LIARSIDEAAEAISSKRRQSLESAALAIVSGLLALAVVGASGRLAVALAAGAAFELLLSATSLLSRRGLIARMSLEPDAYCIPEVVAYGKALTKPKKRAQLADGFRTMVRDALRPGALYLPDRVLRHARELEALARDLRSPAVRVHPASVARCRRLLTEAAESPLYNPRLSEEDLEVILRRIRSGMHRADPD
jgi:hypothetical protein